VRRNLFFEFTVLKSATSFKALSARDVLPCLLPSRNTRSDFLSQRRH
jgi:hypothetical protein